jgi:outer membrane protein TolC
MRKNIKKSILLLLLLPCFLFAQNLQLEDAIKIALKNNEKIKQYEEKLTQNDYKDKQSFGNFLPSINIQGSYNHLDDALKIDLNPIRSAMIQLQANNQVELTNIGTILKGGAALSAAQRAAVYSSATSQLNGLLPAFEETLKEQNYPSASIVAVQPIFLGGKLLAAKNFSSAEKKAAEAELTKTKNDIIQETINNYISVILLNEVIKTRQEVLEGMYRHRTDAKKLADQGLIAPHNLLRAEVAVSDAERNLFDDQNKRELALVALKHTLNFSDDAEIIINDTMVYTGISDSLNNFINQSYISQPVLQLIAQKKEAASQKFVAERAEFLPQIAGFGKYELCQHYLSALEPKWVVGVQVSFNVFNGFKKWNKLQEAEHLEKEVDYLEDYTKKQISLWVNKSYRDMRNSEKRYQMLKASIDLGKENLRLNEKRFQAGLNTSLEVIDARLNLEKNQIERLSSLYDFYKSVADLLSASGNLDKFTFIWRSLNSQVKVLSK